MDNDLKIFLSAKIGKLKLTANDLPDLLKLASKKFLMSTAEILATIGECFYEQGEHSNCLTTLGYYAKETGLTFQEVIFTRYSQQIAEHKKNYEYNVELLKNYQWCFQKEFPAFDNLDKILLFHDQHRQIYFRQQSGLIEVLDKEQIVAHEREKIYLLCEINNLDNLCQWECCLGKHWLADLGARSPLYIYYENVVLWTLILMQGQLDDLLAEQRVVFFLSWGEMEDFFQNYYAITPNTVLFGKDKTASKSKITQDLQTFLSNKVTQTEHLFVLNKRYYEEHSEEVVQNIRSKKPRILFKTTRFTTALQYHIRDCMLACQSLGCETYLIIEPSNIHMTLYEVYIKAIHDFKPDIAFQINYFANRNYFPRQIPWVNWIQDPMPHLLEPKTSQSLSNKDYILSYYPSKEELINIGYQEPQIMVASIPANHLLYRNYPISASESEKYGADIILVANRNNWAKEKVRLVEVLMSVNGLEDNEKECTEILENYYQMIYQEKINLSTPELVEQFFVEQIAIYCNKAWINKALETIVKEFFTYTRAVVFRNVLAEWLIDGGYTNLKLYGNDWGDNAKFAPYAMGVAQNGETLAKIYKSSKILLGTNVNSSSTARVFECFLSGGFYIANYITPESDFVNIRKQYSENEEIPFFYNRKDLYAKLDYYLANPKERTQISERTRKKILENSTYEALMKKMLNWLAEKVLANH